MGGLPGAACSSAGCCSAAAAGVPPAAAGPTSSAGTVLHDARTWAGRPARVDSPVRCADARARGDVGLDRWAGDGDFWLRRSALLAHERAIRTGADPRRFLRYADALLDEREFFVRKAIGWVLRTLSRHDPDAVAGWLLPRAHRASGVTLREALKYCSPEQGAAVRTAASRHP